MILHQFLRIAVLPNLQTRHVNASSVIAAWNIHRTMLLTQKIHAPRTQAYSAHSVTQASKLSEPSEQSKEKSVCNIVAVLQSLPKNCNTAKPSHTIAYGLPTLHACMYASIVYQGKSEEKVKQAKPCEAKPSKAKPSKRNQYSKDNSEEKV